MFKGESIDDIPEAVIQDCAQLVKANSIQGNTFKLLMWSGAHCILFKMLLILLSHYVSFDAN